MFWSTIFLGRSCWSVWMPMAELSWLLMWITWWSCSMMQNFAKSTMLWTFACVIVRFWCMQLNFLGTPICDKISGSDLLPWFCDYHRNNPEVKIYMLGAAPGVAKLAQQRINTRIGREIVVEAQSPSYGFEKKSWGMWSDYRNVSALHPLTCWWLVWAHPSKRSGFVEHRDKLPNIKTFLAVGAAIDFEAGA